MTTTLLMYLQSTPTFESAVQNSASQMVQAEREDTPHCSRMAVFVVSCRHDPPCSIYLVVLVFKKILQGDKTHVLNAKADNDKFNIVLVNLAK